MHEVTLKTLIVLQYTQINAVLLNFLFQLSRKMCQRFHKNI